MSKSIRIRTKPGGDDSYVSVNLTQDFDQLKVLSLSIDQEDIYRSFESNYGVVAGRIDINNGFGLKNAKVSIFIPLDDKDKQNEVKRALYPYETVTDRNENGVRYNLLPNQQQNKNHTPTGTFPSKRQILDNNILVEIYDKYYKYTTSTNDAGDFMFFGVPVGEQQIFIDIDVSDIGFLSVRPYDLIAKGKSEEDFVDRFTFKSSNYLDNLPQIINASSVINVLPFWADDLEEGRKIGITRFDYSVTEYELTPTAMFMGSMFSDNENDSLSKNCRPRKKMGQMNELVTGEGVLEAITRTSSGDIVKSKDIPTDAIDENGNWAVQLPMNIRKVITDENGALIPSPDGKTGIATEADYRFRISMGSDNSIGRKRTRAKMLVPNMTNNYKFGEYSGQELIDAQTAGEPIFKINEQLSYFDEDNDPTIQYNYLEDFYTFRWNKIYTVRQYIPRYQPNGNESPSQKNFIGFKQILDGNGVNKIPYNRLFTKINVLYSFLCFLLTLFAFFVGFVNSIIQLINNIFSNICEFRIPIPCLDFEVGSENYQQTVITYDIRKRKEDGKCGYTGTTTSYSTPHKNQKAKGTCTLVKENTVPPTPTISDDRVGCNGENYKYIANKRTTTEDCKPDGGVDCKKCKETYYEGDESKPYKGLSATPFGWCIRVCYYFEWKWSCPIRGLCNSCSNDNDCNGTGRDGDGECRKPEELTGSVFKYKWESNEKTDQGDCPDRSVFTTSGTLPSECDGLGLAKNTKYFVSGGKTGKKEEACDYLPEGYGHTNDQKSEAITKAKNAAEEHLDDKDKKLDVFKCDTVTGDKPCNCKKGTKIPNVTIGCLRRITGAGTLTNLKADDTCKVNGGVGRGINEFCCNGCEECNDFGKEEYYKQKFNDGTETPTEDNKLVYQCTKNCLGDKCCEKIAPVTLKCSEEPGSDVSPAIYSFGNCGADDLITNCLSCKGVYFSPISNWVACQLEGIATSLGMLDFEFYNDWMNGSLYFPLIKRKVKIKRGRKGKRGQGQVKKDVFCDYDCDGSDPDYQTPDEVNLWSIRIRGGGKMTYEFENDLETCKVTIPRRVSARQWYDTEEKAQKAIAFEGYRDGDVTVPCSFTLYDWCQKEGNVCDDEAIFAGNENKKIILKQKTVDGPHGKPKYLKTGVDSDGDGINDVTVWKNFGGHGHHKNKCKKNYLIERLEYTKTDLSDCVAKNVGPTFEDGFITGAIPVESSNGAANPSSDSDCVLSCGAQGTAACTNACKCDGEYNNKAIYHGLVKEEDNELYYASITESSDSQFENKFYKKNMIFPTNITELGSSVTCDIDEAPFIIDELETTTYQVSEEDLAVKGGAGTDSDPIKLKEKESNINLRAYVDFGCDGVRCMNVRSSLVTAQVGSELFDLNDTGLECNTCSSYTDVDTDIRQYFCRRFSTFIPSLSSNGEEITDMKVNYVRPGSSQGENYYEPYNDDTELKCSEHDGDNKKAVLIDDEGNKGDTFDIDYELNDGDPITPGDKCGYWADGTLSTQRDVKYFYAMDASSRSKNDLKNYPFDGSKLGEDAEEGATILVEDIKGISPFTTQTPYFFYFGLVPGKTALNKLVGKYFSDKINSETLDDISEGPPTGNDPKAGDEKISPDAIIGSCLKLNSYE
jgi:hypothetical protein